MKTAFITGANKSIGFETARQLLQKGYFVYLGSRNLTNGNAAVDKLKKEGHTNVATLQIDVSDLKSIVEAKNKIEQQTGHLDLLINNAGISGEVPQHASDTKTAEIRKVFDTNFFGTIHVTQTFIELLRKTDTPVIVNLTSGLGSLTLQSNPDWEFYAYKGAAYGPSKTALNAYTIALAYEMRDTPFKINAIDPGFTATDLNNHRGTGSVEDAAAFVVKYALLNADGPTGKFFSKDSKEHGNECPW